MNDTAFHNTLPGRSIVGVGAGAIVGFFIEGMWFWDMGNSSKVANISFPVSGAVIGAVCALVFAVFFGSVQLHGCIKHMTIGVLLGIVAALFLGGVLYPEIMSHSQPFG